MNEVVNDLQGSRFVLDVNGQEVYVLYAEDIETLDLYSTYTPSQLRGQGLAEKVVLSAFEYAKEKNLKVLANCWYVRKFIVKHKEYEALLK
jgi:hypothetical protein